MSRKFTVDTAAKEYFGGLISTWLLYEAIKRKELPCVKIGRRILLDEDSLNQWWEQQTTASVAPEPGYGKIRRLI